MNLYKYQSINQYSLAALASGEHWLAKPGTFNDPFEFGLNHWKVNTSGHLFPIIDETGYDGYLYGIDLDVDVPNHNRLNRELQKYKMSFTLQERNVWVLVIREPERYQFPC